MPQANWKAPADTALVIVDVQNDFCPGGNLAVPEGDKIVSTINSLREHFQAVVQTQDWHPAGHKSFASAHSAEPFSTTEMSYGTQVLWPDHCVQGSEGAEFHEDLVVGDDDLVLRKGSNPEVDSYSAFRENDGASQPRFDSGRTFAEEMAAREIKRLVFVGLAREICVAWNAEDAQAAGFETYLVTDAAQPFNPEDDAKKLKDLEDKGVILTTAAKLPQLIAG